MSAKLISDNRRAHDRIAKKYSRRHPEIYNEIEQSRLRDALTSALARVKNGESDDKTVLDYGCGAGNLTHHLLALGATVVAGDVSPRFLELVRNAHPSNPNLRTCLLNGSDLTQFASGKFDMVATYSVLHHVPDYLAIIREIARVVRPGGVVYIDHEKSPEYWRPNPELRRLMRASRFSLRRVLGAMKPSNIYQRLRRVVQPRYQAEGDLHVWPDDHIMWEQIERVLSDNGCVVDAVQDYLEYNSSYGASYPELAAIHSDTRLLVAVKL